MASAVLTDVGYTKITADEFAAIDGLDDWRFVLGTIHAEYSLGSFGAAATFVADIARAADTADHHPDISLRYPGTVRVVLTTHAVEALTTRDVDLARTISGLAAQVSATPSPTDVGDLEIALDTMDADRIRPFWQAVLGYEAVADGALVDPARRGPALWFQQMDEPRTERNRFHLDITVAHEVAEQRVQAAIDAGGRLVSDRRARAFWVLADAEGNEACICTWQDRG